ncbi:hypothetical protein BDAP_000053, partial [Binucleata daphniae]
NILADLENVLAKEIAEYKGSIVTGENIGSLIIEYECENEKHKAVKYVQYVLGCTKHHFIGFVFDKSEVANQMNNEEILLYSFKSFKRTYKEMQLETQRYDNIIAKKNNDTKSDQNKFWEALAKPNTIAFITSNTNAKNFIELAYIRFAKENTSCADHKKNQVFIELNFSGCKKILTWFCFCQQKLQKQKYANLLMNIQMLHPYIYQNKKDESKIHKKRLNYNIINKFQSKHSHIARARSTSISNSFLFLNCNNTTNKTNTKGKTDTKQIKGLFFTVNYNDTYKPSKAELSYFKKKHIGVELGFAKIEIDVLNTKFDIHFCICDSTKIETYDNVKKYESHAILTIVYTIKNNSIVDLTEFYYMQENKHYNTKKFNQNVIKSQKGIKKILSTMEKIFKQDFLHIYTNCPIESYLKDISNFIPFTRHSRAMPRFITCIKLCTPFKFILNKLQIISDGRIKYKLYNCKPVFLSSLLENKINNRKINIFDHITKCSKITANDTDKKHVQLIQIKTITELDTSCYYIFFPSYVGYYETFIEFWKNKTENINDAINQISVKYCGTHSLFKSGYMQNLIYDFLKSLNEIDAIKILVADRFFNMYEIGQIKIFGCNALSITKKTREDSNTVKQNKYQLQNTKSENGSKKLINIAKQFMREVLQILSLRYKDSADIIKYEILIQPEDFAMNNSEIEMLELLLRP